jgi:hypothetical protein
MASRRPGARSLTAAGTVPAITMGRTVTGCRLRAVHPRQRLACRPERRPGKRDQAR